MSGFFNTQPVGAGNVPYDNATSGLAATELQAAIDEVVAEAPMLKSTLAGPQDHLEYRVSGEWYRVFLHSVANTSGGVVPNVTNAAPISSDGQVGDYWIHSSGGGNAQILYGPKQSDNSWPKIGKAVGNPNSPLEPEGFLPLPSYGPAETYKEPYNPSLIYQAPTKNYAIAAGFVSAGANSRFYQVVLWELATESGWYPAVDPVRWNLEHGADINLSNVQDNEVLSWDSATAKWINKKLDAADVLFDNATSGLFATDVQAAIDEVDNEKLDIPGFVLWENLDWVTLITGTGAPSSATGGSGWFYLDTTASSEELYGPAFFDQSIPGFNWGSPLANFTFSATGPTNEAGDWYVWDENGDGSVYTLFQKKTAINYGDMLFYSGVDWEARSRKISAHNVYANMVFIDTAYGVGSVENLLGNLFANYAQAYSGGNGYYVETNIDTTFTINPYYANGFVLTLEDDTTIDFASNWDPTSQLGPRFCELTIVLKQDSTGSHVVTWDSNVEVSSGTSLTTTANAVDMLKAVSWDNGTSWYVTQIGANFS